MDLFVCRIVTVVFILLHSAEIYAMTTLSRSSARAAKTPQARSYIRPTAMHKVDKPVKKTELKKFNLGHGLALLESQTLSNLYEAANLYKAESQKKEAPALLQIVAKMFYRVMADGEIAITKSIGNVPTFITPTIMGILIGSIESEQTEKGRIAFNIAITAQWDGSPEVEKYRAELKNEKERNKYNNKFKENIDIFFDLVHQQSQEDKDALNAILLAFLYKKIHHDDPNQEFHDWMDFLASLNEYIPVFSDEELDASRKKLLQTSDIPSSFESTVFAVKSKIISPSIVSSSMYGKFLTNNFPLVLSDIIEKMRKQSIYPPIVTSGMFGYQNQPKKADCVETAVRELLFNLFYDNIKRVFDVSKYPGLSLIPALKEYLGICNPDNMNTVAMGQLFFDMVSDRRPEIKYTGTRNYEMISSEGNILAILNVLLNIHAADWDDLGKELTQASNDAMEVVCQRRQMSDGTIMIDITIADKKAKIIRSLALNISKGHSFVTSQAEKLAKQKINLEYLLKQDNINPQIKSIFYLSPTSVNLKFSKQQFKDFGPLLYYSWPTRTQDEKIAVIKKIIRGGFQDAGAMQYAYGIFKSLDPLRMELLFLNINLFIAYCNDKKFIDETKDEFLKTIPLDQALNFLLERMPFSDARNLLLSIVDEKRFKDELKEKTDLLWDLLDTKYGNGLLAYIVKNDLVGKDFDSETIFIRQIIDKLSNDNFIQNFHKEYPVDLDTLLKMAMDFAQSYTDKIKLCHFFLHQNIDSMDSTFQLYFYKKIFVLYIGLLNRKYSDITKLGDIRPRLEQYPELYALYDREMKAAEQRASAITEKKKISKE